MVVGAEMVVVLVVVVVDRELSNMEIILRKLIEMWAIFREKHLLWTAG